MRNNFDIFSREQNGRGARLELELAAADTTPPAAPLVDIRPDGRGGLLLHLRDRAADAPSFRIVNEAGATDVDGRGGEAFTTYDDRRFDRLSVHASDAAGNLSAATEIDLAPYRRGLGALVSLRARNVGGAVAISIEMDAPFAEAALGDLVVVLSPAEVNRANFAALQARHTLRADEVFTLWTDTGSAERPLRGALRRVYGALIGGAGAFAGVAQISDDGGVIALLSVPVEQPNQAPLYALPDSATYDLTAQLVVGSASYPSEAHNPSFDAAAQVLRATALPGGTAAWQLFVPGPASVDISVSGSADLIATVSVLGSVNVGRQRAAAHTQSRHLRAERILGIGRLGPWRPRLVVEAC